MNKNKHRTPIISSEEISTNSYNTSEDEDDISKQDFKNSIRLKKERMNKFFLENPNLLNYFDFKEDSNKDHFNENVLINGNKKDVYGRSFQKCRQGHMPQNIDKMFLEDVKHRKEQKVLTKIDMNKKKMLKIMNDDVNDQMNLKNKVNTKALEQLFKKINVFKTQILEKDKSPFIEGILEEEVDYQSDNDSEDSNKYKKNEQKKGSKAIGFANCKTN